MKLATYKDGSRDGQLVVVSRDLSQAHYAHGIAGRLQQVLDDWNFLSPQLEDLYVTLNQGKARHAFNFEPRQCMAPLPRPGLRVEAQAWPHHQGLPALAPLAPNATSPDAAAADSAAPTSATSDKDQPPPMAAAAGSPLQGPCDDAWFGAEAWGIDFGAGLAAICGDVAPGANAEQGLDGIRLLMLANSWRLRALMPAEAAIGLGLLQSAPACAFSPVAVTPDELGEAWRRGKLRLNLQTSLNGKKVGLGDAGADMAWHFGRLVAHLAKTRAVPAGALVGAGVVCAADPARGFHSLADRRTSTGSAGNTGSAGSAASATNDGQPAVSAAWLKLGDRVRIEMKGPDGHSVFGAIDQRVTGPGLDDRLDLADAAPSDDQADAQPADAGAPETPSPSAADSALPTADPS